MRRRYILLPLAVAALAGSVVAAESRRDSVRFEATVRELELSIIAPCCWHQPVANHASQIAIEIRKEIRQMVGAGMTPDQIKAEYVHRYGERILAVPPKNAFNRFLWIIPIAASVGAFGIAGHLLGTWRKGKAAARPSVAGTGNAAHSSASLARVDEALKKWDEA